MEEKKKSFITKERLISALIGFAIGVIILLLVAFCLDYFAKSAGIARLVNGEDTIAKVDGEAISTQTIYDKLKNSYGLKYVINEVDNIILKSKYENLTEEEEKSIKEDAEYYVDYYTTLGYVESEEEFLENNGFDSYEEYVEDIRSNYRYNKYLYDYLESKLEEGAVQKYYEENKDSIETYDSEHILVKPSDTLTDEEALAMANEIIAKLNEGKTFSEVAEEYKDSIIHEELGFQGKSSSIEQAYIDELVALKDGEYSKTPVQTSYGYHIVHKISTSTMEDLRETIIEILAEDMLTEDTNLTYKAIVELEKEYNLEIYDEKLKKQYDEYVESLYEEDTDE